MADDAPRLTVLVAEDQDELADVIEYTLGTFEATTVRVRDGAEVLDVLPLLRPDILLLDLCMPQLDGFDVLRALPTQPHRPVVVAMSAFHEFLGQARRLGATAALAKPFGVAELRGAVETARAERPPAAHAALPASGEPLAPAPTDDDELARVRRVYCLRLVSAGRDEALDALVELTAELLRTPIALVSIITEDRQWWKAMYGVTGDLARARGTERDVSFCTHAVAARAPLVVRDARDHPVFKHNRLVRDGVLDAYAGVPIVIPGIGALGTLCVLDTSARTFSYVDLELLGLLAERAAAEIEWRERPAASSRPLGTFHYLSLFDEQHGVLNAAGFESMVAVIARLAMRENGSFALLAVRAPGGEPDVVRAVATALRQAARRADAVGWLDANSLAALLPRSGHEDVAAFGARAGAAYAALRAAGGGRLPELACVDTVESGVLMSAPLLHRLRGRVQRDAPA